MRSDEVEDTLIDAISKHFGGAAKDFVVKESTDVPFLQLSVEMTLYNYLVVRAAIEKNTLFFSVVQSGFQLQLFRTSVADDDLKNSPMILDDEVRLRIPDKYLRAKGWL